MAHISILVIKRISSAFYYSSFAGNSNLSKAFAAILWHSFALLQRPFGTILHAFFLLLFEYNPLALSCTFKPTLRHSPALLQTLTNCSLTLLCTFTITLWYYFACIFSLAFLKLPFGTLLHFYNYPLAFSLTLLQPPFGGNIHAYTCIQNVYT